MNLEFKGTRYQRGKRVRLKIGWGGDEVKICRMNSETLLVFLPPPSNLLASRIISPKEKTGGSFSEETEPP
jgi:hypothetical protein